MPHTQHSASDTAETLSCEMSLIAVRIPAALNWSLRKIAADRQTTRTRLLVQVIEDFVGAQNQRGGA